MNNYQHFIVKIIKDIDPEKCIFKAGRLLLVNTYPISGNTTYNYTATLKNTTYKLGQPIIFDYCMPLYPKEFSDYTPINAHIIRQENCKRICKIGTKFINSQILLHFYDIKNLNNYLKLLNKQSYKT